MALCEAYVAAGLDPSRFWDCTPRLIAIEMTGAAIRLQRERELTWWGAMLPYLEKRPTLEQFAGRPVDHRSRAAQFHAAWDRVDRALARH